MSGQVIFPCALYTSFHMCVELGFFCQQWNRCHCKLFSDRLVSGQWPVISGQWLVDSGQLTVGSGQWTVASGQWTVASGQWRLASGQ